MNIITVVGWWLFLTLGASLINTSFQHDLRTVGWALVSLLGLLFAPYIWLNDQSFVQATLALFVGVYGIYVTYLIASQRMMLRQMSILVTVSSGILLASYTIPSVQWYLIETVTSDINWVLELLGYETELEEASNGIFISFVETSPTLRTKIIMACTGIGSIGLFVGLAAALDTLSLWKRSVITIACVSLIYVLNIIRNVFIAAAYADQWFAGIAPSFFEATIGLIGPSVSFYIAHNIISQIAAVFVLLGIAIGILRLLDEEAGLWLELISLIEETNASIQRYK